MQTNAELERDLDARFTLAADKIRLPFSNGKSPSPVPMACASNDFPLHSRLWIIGLGECVVLDRMNPRYSGKGVVDMYFGFDVVAAKTFGIKQFDIFPLE